MDKLAGDIVPCCTYRDHHTEDGAEWCTCPDHPRSQLHPLGWRRSEQPAEVLRQCSTSVIAAAAALEHAGLQYRAERLGGTIRGLVIPTPLGEVLVTDDPTVEGRVELGFGDPSGEPPVSLDPIADADALVEGVRSALRGDTPQGG